MPKPRKVIKTKPLNPYSILESKLVWKERLGTGQIRTVTRVTVGKEEKNLVKKTIHIDYVGKEKEAKRLLTREAKLLRLFEINGIKVPKNIKVDLRKGQEGLWMEDLSQEGEIIETHVRGNPIKFRELSIQKHEQTIRELARQLKTIHSLGYHLVFDIIDIWVFIKKGGQLIPAVVDTEFITKSKKRIQEHRRENVEYIGCYLGKEEFQLFKKEYVEYAPKLVK